MDELKAFFATVQPGTRVKVTNHDYLRGSGMRTVERVTDQGVTFKLDRPERSQGRVFRTSSLRLDLEHDYEIEDRTLKIYNPSHAYVNGRRAIVLTMEFEEVPDAQ